MARQMALVNRELAQHNRKVIRTTSRWLELYEFAKFLEEEDLLARDPVSGQRQALLGTVALVRGLGVLLLAKLQNDDAEQLKALGCSFRDLSACVEELADLERGLKSDLSDAMVAEMDQRLFAGGKQG